jgi:hypothetical protein
MKMEKKHLIALEDGVRESTQSWREVLLGAKVRDRTPFVSPLS